MPLRYLHFTDLDLTAWDACVAAAQPAAPYAYSWWLVATAVRWDAIVEPDEATNGYRSVLPLPARQRAWGREIHQPAFTQQLGLLTTAASHCRDPAAYLALTAGRYARFYTQANIANGLFTPPPPFLLTKRRTYLLDLSPDYHTLLACYAADYRRRLRLNQRQPQPLVVTEITVADKLIALFRQQKDGTIPGFRDRHYRNLANLTVALQARGHAWLLAVHQPATEELLAGALFVRHAHGLIYLFAAASPAGKKAGAPLLLLDHAIRQHAGTPGYVLDFEGGMIPSIARFFANFGATPVSYAALGQIRKPWYLRWIR